MERSGFCGWFLDGVAKGYLFTAREAPPGTPRPHPSLCGRNQRNSLRMRQKRTNIRLAGLDQTPFANVNSHNDLLRTRITGVRLNREIISRNSLSLNPISP